jgi:hypothetical protein
MLLLFTVILMTMPAVALAFHLAARVWGLGTAESLPDRALPPADADRYRPMLRLLSGDDVALVSGHPALAKKLRVERIQIFRGYLRCISRDYGRLLAAIRFVMAAAQEDRPDLAGALYRYQISFAVALCRIEISLALYRLGVGAVDCSVLVDALDQLRSKALILVPVPSQAR